MQHKNELKTIEQKEIAIADAVSVETIQTELGIGIVAITLTKIQSYIFKNFFIRLLIVTTSLNLEKWYLPH